MKREQVLRIHELEPLMDFFGKNIDLFKKRSPDELMNLSIAQLRKRRDIIDHTFFIAKKNNFDALADKLLPQRNAMIEVSSYKGMIRDLDHIQSLISRGTVEKNVDLDSIMKLYNAIELFENTSVLVKNGNILSSNVVALKSKLSKIIFENKFLLAKKNIAINNKFKSNVKSDLLGEENLLELEKIKGSLGSTKEGVSESYLVFRKGEKNPIGVYKPSGKYNKFAKTIGVTDKTGHNQFGIRPGTEHLRDLAGRYVDKELGLNVVPPTFKVNIEGKGVGSIQEFVPKSVDYGTITKRSKDMSIPISLRDRNVYIDEKISILDMVIGNQDRHMGNILFSKEGATAAIDVTNSFAVKMGGEKSGIYGVLGGSNPNRYIWSWMEELNRPYSDESIEIIKNIDVEKLSTQLSEKFKIEDKAIDLMRKRVERLKSMIMIDPKQKISEIAIEVKKAGRSY